MDLSFVGLDHFDCRPHQPLGFKQGHSFTEWWYAA
jgi:hypothetical protein